MDKTQYTPLSQAEEHALEHERDESYPMSQSRAGGYAPYHDTSRQSESSFSDDEDVLKHPIEPLDEDDEDYEANLPRKQVGSSSPSLTIIPVF
jgi:hypothetical protein